MRSVKAARFVNDYIDHVVTPDVAPLRPILFLATI